MNVLHQEGDYAVIKYNNKPIAYLQNKRPIPREAHYIALNVMRAYKHEPKENLVWLETASEDLKKLQQIFGGE